MWFDKKQCNVDVNDKIRHRFDGLCKNIYKAFSVLSKEFYILTSMETRQLFCRMFIALKNLKSFFILLKMK